MDALHQLVAILIALRENRVIRHRHQVAALDVRHHRARTREKVAQAQLVVPHVERLVEVPADDVDLALRPVPDFGDAVAALLGPLLRLDRPVRHLLAELLLDLARGQVVVAGDPIHVCPSRGGFPVEALPRHVDQFAGLRGDDFLAQRPRRELWLVLDPRHAEASNQEIVHRAVCVLVQRCHIHMRGDAALDEERRLLRERALRP